MTGSDIPSVSPERQLFVIFDRVADAMVGPIMIERHPGPACRMFAQLLGDKNTQLAAHPKDYELRHVGYIDDQGNIACPNPPQTVMTGESWLSLKEKSSEESQ